MKTLREFLKEQIKITENVFKEYDFKKSDVNELLELINISYIHMDFANRMMRHLEIEDFSKFTIEKGTGLKFDLEKTPPVQGRDNRIPQISEIIEQYNYVISELDEVGQENYFNGLSTQQPPSFYVKNKKDITDQEVVDIVNEFIDKKNDERKKILSNVKSKIKSIQSRMKSIASKYNLNIQSTGPTPEEMENKEYTTDFILNIFTDYNESKFYKKEEYFIKNGQFLIDYLKEEDLENFKQDPFYFMMLNGEDMMIRTISMVIFEVIRKAEDIIKTSHRGRYKEISFNKTEEVLKYASIAYRDYLESGKNASSYKESLGIELF